MKNSLDTINTFCRNDGFKINIDKTSTECISIGDLKNQIEKILKTKLQSKLFDVYVFI